MKRAYLTLAAVAVVGCARSHLEIAPPDAGRPREDAGAPDEPRIIHISSGAAHTCAVRDTGSVSCWGRNQFGQLGDGAKIDRARPSAVRALHDAVQVSAGAAHTCARRATDSVVCWGSGRDGRLGAGRVTPEELEPVVVSGLADVAEVAAGGAHTCARRWDGTVACWGDNRFGQLGDGTTTARRAPTEVLGLLDATDIAAGTDHTCAVRGSGEVWCWGNDEGGKVSVDGSPRDHYPRPIPIADVVDAEEVTAGDRQTCIRQRTGGAQCWGGTYWAYCCNGMTEIVLVVDTAQVDAGGAQVTCSRDRGGAVECWSMVFGGVTPPAQPTGLTDADAVTVGGSGMSATVVESLPAGFHACARRRNGRVVCWGDNQYGQLGDGTTLSTWVPVEVTAL